MKKISILFLLFLVDHRTKLFDSMARQWVLGIQLWNHKLTISSAEMANATLFQPWNIF